MGWHSMMSWRKREWHQPSHALKSSSDAARTFTCASSLNPVSLLMTTEGTTWTAAFFVYLMERCTKTGCS
jgi:hypothetical protein